MAERFALRDAAAPACGGKARGLYRLLQLGLRVPNGFVLTGVTAQDDVEALLEPALTDGAWAVRSSAVDEDGAEHSFAGQYVTHLNCVGLKAAARAVRDCVTSASSERLTAYIATRAHGANTEVAVIVMRMVPAKRSGVLFTADPVTSRRDRWILNLVDGLGEALVSGTANSTQSVYVGGQCVEGPGLPAPIEASLLDGARRLHEAMGRPVDIEFAIDGNDVLWFLQGRPITALCRVHPNELDAIDDVPGAVYTTANVSEMMPGPVTPLTGTVFGSAVDRGMQDYMIRIGAQDDFHDGRRYIYTSYQHMFIRLDAVYASPRACFGASKRDVDLAIVGKPVPEAAVGRFSTVVPSHL